MLRLTRKQVREVDRIAIEAYGLPGIVLMENAARGAAEVIQALRDDEDAPHRAVLFCGKGNNGGDGFAIARHLGNAGWAVRIILCCEPHEIAGDALINFRIIQHMGLPIRPLAELNESDDLQSGTIAVDAVFGTGFRPPGRFDLRPIDYACGNQATTVVAIDLPSGMDADTGEVIDENAIRADHTVTFVAEKTGFVSPTAKRYLGRIHVVDIGAPRAILDRVKDIA